MNKYLQEEIEISRLSTEEQDKETNLAILKFFYPNDTRNWIECIIEFIELQAKHIEYNIKMDLNFEKKPARYYIKADTLLANADIVGLYNHLSGRNEKAITIQFAKQVKNEFLYSVDYFKEKYEWLYNTPILPGINKHSIGRELRNEFQQYYGQYAEITYLLACGDALKFDEVNGMVLSEYLALGEYIYRKRLVESVE